MLTELWESLCGYDKWTQTEATIESTYYDQAVVTSWSDIGRNDRNELTPTKVNRATSVLAWADQSGIRYSARYTVTEPSPLYGVNDGTVVTIRYNPSNPRDYYFPELQRDEGGKFLRKAILFMVLSGIALYFLFQRYLQHPH
ncbi:MAG: DUF3592 domain-containing protein [Terracidiphilus sp.]|jgi:hypothetical protein